MKQASRPMKTSLMVVSAALLLSACGDSSVQGCSTGNEAACDELLKSCLLFGAVHPGHCTEEELTGAVRIFRKSCESDNAKGCVSLMELCEKRCSPEELRGAAKGVQRSCESGVAKSCGPLGALYASGTGVTEDDDKAAQLFQEACDGGDAKSCRYLGERYATSPPVDSVFLLSGHGATPVLGKQFGAKGIWKDDTKALHFYQMACNGADYLGCLNLSYIYEHGLGVPRDSAKAAVIYKQAQTLNEQPKVDK